MRDIWSENRRLQTHRQLWIALAESQMEVGLMDSKGKPRIHPEMISELRAHVDSFKEDPREISRLGELEEECKHDVVAHIRLLGELCPKAKEIIHLGATSCDITDNADLILVRESLVLVRHRLIGVIDKLAQFAEAHIDLSCIAYTHYQSAQFTTLGKRTCLWIADLVEDLAQIDRWINDLCFRGLKGATGTQASYLELLGNARKVEELENLFANKMGFKNIYLITGQTYSRKYESMIMSVLSGIGQTLHKFGCDMRLLQHDQELQESFSKTQVGSSAMGYKKNPHKCERMCSLSRYLVNECHNFEMTAMTQWLERTLDDSAVRRLSLPNAFMAADAILKLALNISSGIIVNRNVIRRRTMREMPFVATEGIMMKAVKAGGDRQAIHALIRDESVYAAQQVAAGDNNDLLRNLAKNPLTSKAVFDSQEDFSPENYTGLAEHQAKEFLSGIVAQIRDKYPESLGQNEDVLI